MEQQIQHLSFPCRRQLEGLKNDLMQVCQAIPRLVYIGQDCNEKVGMVFAGKDPPRFLWNLAASEKEAMLWAGMWDGAGSEEGRTTKQALFDFANLVDASTVHPSTELGKMVEKHGDLQDCSYDKDRSAYESFTGHGQNEGLIPNFWKKASKAFVTGMAQKNQSRVVILVNKDLDPTAERSFYKSVLYNYELEQMAKEIHYYDYWRPQVVVIDLKGTCEKMIRAMKRRLLAVPIEHYNEGSVQRWLMENPFRCLPCAVLQVGSTLCREGEGGVQPEGIPRVKFLVKRNRKHCVP